MQELAELDSDVMNAWARDDAVESITPEGEAELLAEKRAKGPAPKRPTTRTTRPAAAAKKPATRTAAKKPPATTTRTVRARKQG